MDKTDRLCVDSAGQCIYVFMYIYIYFPQYRPPSLLARERSKMSLLVLFVFM